MRDYEVRTRDRFTGASRGWMKISELPTPALYWLRDECDWNGKSSLTVSHNEADIEDIKKRVEIEFVARAIEGRL